MSIQTAVLGTRVLAHFTSVKVRRGGNVTVSVIIIIACVLQWFHLLVRAVNHIIQNSSTIIGYVNLVA